MFKKSVIPGLFAGVLYASVLAFIDHNDGVEFNIGVFIINLILFGAFMSGYNYFAMKRRMKRKEKEEAVAEAESQSED